MNKLSNVKTHNMQSPFVQSSVAHNEQTRNAILRHINEHILHENVKCVNNDSSWRDFSTSI